MVFLPAHRAALCVALLAAPTPAQTTEFLVDCGDWSLPTGARAQVWNDLHNNNWSQSLPLVDSNGNASSVSLLYYDPLGRSEISGVQVPTPSSALEQLGWPQSAIGDAIWSDTFPLEPEIVLELSGLDAQATYDFTILGSSLQSGVSLATEYTVFGQADVTVLGEPAQNTSTVSRLVGLRPRADGTLDLRVRNGTTNTSHGRRYYLNAFSMVEHPPGTQPLVLGFTTNRLSFGRVAGSKGVLATTTGVYTSDGSTPQVDLQLIDLNTGFEPLWLYAPPLVMPGTPFSVIVDPGELAPGTYTAQLTASADGYVTYGMRVVLVVRAPGRLNLLYYGNSYTNANGMVSVLVDRLAEEAGLDVPMSVSRTSSNKNLTYHLNATQTLAISRSLPLGEEWDQVILQGGINEAAATVGNPAQFVADGLAILANVRAHSPGVSVSIFQTWARGAGHKFYTGTNPKYPGGPLDMHRELEDGNEQLAQAIDAAYGPGTAVVAPAGETAALRGFDPAYYRMDLSHPAEALTAQTGAVVFSAIFELPTCTLPLDFLAPGPVASHLAGLGLSEDDWHSISAIADRAGPPELREFPGSEEDFLLTSGPLGLETACSQKQHAAGTPLAFELSSPAGSYAANSAWLYLDLVGQPGGSTVVPPWSEVHLTPSAWVAASAPALGSSGLTFQVVLPIELVGRTVLIQGLSDGLSPNTGNGLTLSDAHAVDVIHSSQQAPQGSNP